MADGWLNYAQYQAYGYEAVAESNFPQLAARAALLILEGTHWRAATAQNETCIKALQDCEALLISDAQVRLQTSGDGMVTSVNNDGYTESYASAADLRKEAALRNRETILRSLGGPATSWMLYAGGVYHPPARH